MSILEEKINKGVPVETPIILPANDLISACSNGDKVKSVIEFYFEQYMNYLKGIVPTEDIDFFYTLGVTTDKDTLEKKICFAPSGFLSSLFYNLNVGDICHSVNTRGNIYYGMMNLEDCLDDVENRLELLGKIATNNQLKKEFPLLYKKYQSQNKLLVDITNMYRTFYKMKAVQPKMSLQKTLELLSQMTSCLKTLGLKDEDALKACNGELPIDNFCGRYFNTFQGLVDNASNICNHLLSSPIDFGKLSNEDNERVSLYIANQFLLLCCNGKNIEEKQRFLYHLTSYFNENSKRKSDDETSIVVGKINNVNLGVKKSGKRVTPKMLYDEYKRIVVENPELHVLDFDAMDFSGMNLCEVEAFMIEYLKDLKANWDIIPASQMNQDFMPTDSNIRNYKSEEEKKEKQEKLVKLYMDKKEFYDSTDPFFRIIGKNTFEGYVGHIYTNGVVVLDKFFENEETKRVAEGQAIYVMDISDFYRLSSLPKQELIHNPLCRRVYHKGDWQSRVREIIKEGSSVKTANELKRLIKSGKVEKPQ